MAGQIADRACSVGVDCTSAIRQFESPVARQLRATNQVAGIHKFALSLPGRQHVTVQHVKAHRSAEAIDALDEAERRLALASASADHAAKAAICLHPSPDPSFLHGAAIAEKRALLYAKLAAAVLPLFEAASPAMRWRRPTAIQGRRRRVLRTGWHDWGWGELGWQCSQCFCVGPQAGNLPLTGCCGTPKFLEAFTRTDFGHRIVAVSGVRLASARDTAERAQILCLRCGAWGQEKAIKLSRQCCPPTRTGGEVLSRFRRGLAPNPRVRAVIDAAVPAARVGIQPTTRRQAQQVEVIRDFAAVAEPQPYEQRMAALFERVRQRELARTGS